MKRIILQLGFLSTIFFINNSSAQTILAEDFATSIPASWTLNTSGGATWVYNNMIGVNQTGCMLIDQSQSSGATKGSIETPAVDLTTVNYPTLSFKVASIRSNFVAPVFNIYYSTGGAWQLLSSWGEYQTDHLINTSGPCSPTVSSTCASWVSVTYDLAAVANNTNIKFAFEGDLINGGWLLVDDLKIAERKVYTLPYTQGFEDEYFIPEDWQRRDDTSSAFVQWQHNRTVGSFNSKSSAMFDNWNSNVDSTFTLDMVWFDFTNTIKPVLRFDYAYAKRTGKQSDKLSIWYKISSNGTETMLVEYADNDLTTTFDRSNQFVPNNREWLIKYVDLSQFIGVKDIRFSLRNTSKNGNVVYVDNIQFYNDTATSIANTAHDSYLTAYPNPTKDVVFVDAKGMQVRGVVLTDIVGRDSKIIDYKQFGNKISIQLDGLPNGLYTLSLFGADGVLGTARISLVK